MQVALLLVILVLGLIQSCATPRQPYTSADPPLIKKLFYVPPPAEVPDLFRLKWKVYVGRENQVNYNHPLIFGSYILHTSNGNENDVKDNYDRLYVFDQNGKLVWSFEGTNDMNGPVACAEYILVADENGYVYSLSWEGKLRWKFKAENGITTVAIRNMDFDGIPDAIVGSWDGNIYVLSGKDGKLIRKYRVSRTLNTSPALGDIDGDGYIDIVVLTEAVSGKKEWRVSFRTHKIVASSPSLGDINKDGYLDIATIGVGVKIYTSGVYIIPINATLISGKNLKPLWSFKLIDAELYPLFEDLIGTPIASSPALGDINGDGYVDVVAVDSLNIYPSCYLQVMTITPV